MTPESLKRIKQVLIEEMVRNNVEPMAWHEVFLAAAMAQDMETMNLVVNTPGTSLDEEDLAMMRATLRLMGSVTELADRINGDDSLDDDQVRDMVEAALRQIQEELGPDVQVRSGTDIEAEAALATKNLLDKFSIH
jgi:hypothetical protein